VSCFSGVTTVDMLLFAIVELNEEYLTEFNSLFSKGYHPDRAYSIELTEGFCKSLEKCNNTVKGRVLEAIVYLTKEPLVGVGDTLVPLKNEEEKWRYRIGDYRLTYYPEEKNGVVRLLDFGPRGEIYRR